jgi:outer membrane protein OmpA-like peptidoglycan-associated protein
MRKGAIVFLIVLLAFWTFNAAADSLLFPISADQIVEALSLKDGKTEYMGVTYESKSGKVYKVIDGKRYRLRGLRIIADTKLVPKVGALINFDFDSAEIRLDSYPLLDEFGKALKGDLSIASVIIAGHTDHRGSKEYNQKLSEDRAKSVKNYLHTYHGIDSKRMAIKGFGETKPIASNNTDDGRFKNRRVEFIRIE